MRAWWSVFCSISKQFQRFPFLVGFGLVVALSSAGTAQGLKDAGLVVGVLLDL
jgi:hypothetical protein